MHDRMSASPASTSLLVLTLRSKEFNSMNIWSCYDARPFGRASPPPDGNCPDIEAVMKRSDVQRGIEPVCHSGNQRDTAVRLLVAPVHLFRAICVRPLPSP
jgi:hypothetical protein